MRAFKIILIHLCIINVASAQSEKISFAKDVRIAVENAIQRRLGAAKVVFIARQKTYTARYIELNQNYRFDSLPKIKGVIKVSHKGYESQSREVTPVDGRSNANIEHPFYFTLGKPGNAYTIRDGRLFPYTPDHFYWSVEYWKNDYDSVVQYLHQKGFMVLTHYKEVRAIIVYPYQDSSKNYRILPGQDPLLFKKPGILNKENRSQQYETLLSFQLIRSVCPVLNHDLYGFGFLSNYINIKFVPRTTPEQKQMLYDKYNLELYKSGAGQWHTVKVLKHGDQINETAIKLMKETSVELLSTTIGTFKLPQPDE